MPEEILLNNYSDDSQIKKYIANVLMPRVFNDIPLNVLNTGHTSIISEYTSQAIEQMAFTSSFYFNESFITKAVLPDSIYSEAAIFNIGYSFATPSTSMFLFELKIEDIFANAVKNNDKGVYEFILDKDTKFNLKNGNVYSLDYDILIQYKDIATASGKVPAWNVQYINTEEQNSIAVNKNVYIMYRVTDTWLCLFITASEYERKIHKVVNNTMNGIPNQDTVITCRDHICGFDIKYIDNKGNERYIAKDHILPIHSSVKDTDPYVHYIMDNPQTIRFMWQLNGSKYFVPPTNTSFEICIYTCHGKAANFTAFKNDEQPSVITAMNKYSNNGNVVKAAFVISGSTNGTDIGTTETVRRETIEAYNTANIISSDHDLLEYFETFYFKNIMYPFFFKRRDDPWGRIWSGYVALTDDDGYVYKTNTLHGNIPYQVLHANDNNTINSNEVIIPPGWVWTYYDDSNRYTVTPYIKGDGVTVEKANTLANISDKFVFANPFGVRIQKDPFAIGYFNPWINEYVSTNKIVLPENTTMTNENDPSIIYHASPLITNIKRTYKDNYYKITTVISPTIASLSDGTPSVPYVKQNSVPLVFTEVTWNYFKYPLDLYANDIPMMGLTSDMGYLPFDPNNTFICVHNKEKISDNKFRLSGIWIEDYSDEDNKKSISIPITGGNITGLIGDAELWSNQIIKEIPVTGDTIIRCSSNKVPGFDDHIKFERMGTNTWYQMFTVDGTPQGFIEKIQVGEAIMSDKIGYSELSLAKIGKTNDPNVYIHIKFAGMANYITYTISNAYEIYIPYDSPDGTIPMEYDDSGVLVPTFNFGELSAGPFLYADMKPIPQAGAIDYYRVSFADIMNTFGKNQPIFHIENKILPVEMNSMRVILHAYMNGTETGRIEMIPSSREQDGTYIYEATAYPLNQLVDIDNRISIASVNNGGGSWVTSHDTTVTVDATNPDFKITILMRSSDELRPSEIEPNDSFTGFRIVDQYILENVCLLQELKEMRSVVNFGESSIPKKEYVDMYNEYIALNQLSATPQDCSIAYISKYAYDVMHGSPMVPEPEFTIYKTLATYSLLRISMLNELYTSTIPEELQPSDSINALNPIIECLTNISSDGSYQIASLEDKCVVKVTYHSGKIFDITTGNEIKPEPDMLYYDINTHKTYTLLDRELKSIILINWTDVFTTLNEYNNNINYMFQNINIHGGVEVQLMPFVEYSLMNSDRFENFVASFTQVHKAMEPVIMHRLEGNNYLDCKLIATYGLPHSYSSELDQNIDNVFWPDLNVQIEFDVKLYNQSLSTNTINELRSIVKSYFNRITTVHTSVDMISMDNNIYVSHLIQQMESHPNVAYLRFIGWYTNEKNKVKSNYMDANTQSIVQKWKSLDDFPKQELERFTPEMFILEEQNIVLNILN